MAGSFEAKKHGYRQTQDGVVVSFVLHPNDLDASFAVAPLGTRYMIGFAEIGDDEKPIGPIGSPSQKSAQADLNKAHGAMVETLKPRTPFHELKLSQQAGIRCGDEQFKWFLMYQYPIQSAKSSDPADIVRYACNVTSRAELDSANGIAGNLWLGLEQRYQQWLTDKRYKDSYR